MSIAAATFAENVQLIAAPTVLYSCPRATTAVITHALFNNASGGSQALSVWIVPAANLTPIAASNSLLNAFTLANNANYVSGELMGAVLTEGDTIQASGNGITVYISGYTQI